MTKESFQDKITGYVIRAIQVVNILPENMACEMIGKQLMNSVTLLAGSYRNAIKAKNKNHFIKNLATVEKYAEDCAFWLEIISGSGIVESRMVEELREEASDIVGHISNTIKNRYNDNEEMIFKVLL